MGFNDGAEVASTSNPDSYLMRTVPVSGSSDWITINSNPLAADNSGSLVLNPSGISRAAVRRLKVYPFGTAVAVRFRYETGASAITSPTVQLFGIDKNGRVQKLRDAAGNHSLTLTANTATDVRDGAFNYTDEVEVDAKGCLDVLCAIQVAAVGTSMPSPSIEGRVF